METNKAGASVEPVLIPVAPVHGTHAIAARSRSVDATGPRGLSQKLSYFALIELYRTFLFEDGPLLETIRDEGGSLAPSTLARIAQSYAVSRTIPRSPESDPAHNLELFATAVTELSRSWPADFQGRAKACRDVATKLGNEFVTRPTCVKTPSSGPHSAVTKLIWFLRPDGWTVYDKLGADAVLRSDGSTAERQARFYFWVEEFLAEAVQRTGSGLTELEPRLHAERLVDKFLVLTSLSKKPDLFSLVEQKNSHFLRLLPPPLARRVHESAMDITTKLQGLDTPSELGRGLTLSELQKQGLWTGTAKM